MVTKPVSLSSCYLHQPDPAAGICPSCLRERLHGLDSPGGIAAVASPELRRCRSVLADKCRAPVRSHEPRRMSCDVGARSLFRLFDVDDERNGCNGIVSKDESKDVIWSPAVALRTGDDDAQGGKTMRSSESKEDSILELDREDEGELKTMKEHIDLELQRKSQKLKDFKQLAGSFLGAASAFRRKLPKWRHSQKKKLNKEEGVAVVTNEPNNRKEKALDDIHSAAEAAGLRMGRRSCDTEPRFPIDARRHSFDEPSASWDGYLIARTIPRLAPMLSVVENAILNGGNTIEKHRISIDGAQMHSIMEDESSSGGSAQSHSNSDSSSSHRRSSFDRSSSVRSFGKKYMGLEGNEAKYGSNDRASPQKLVITQSDLKDWHLNSIRKTIESPSGQTARVADTGDASKKQAKWRKVWGVFSLKQKSCENPEREVAVEAAMDGTGWKLMRSNSIIGARRSCEVIRSNTGMFNLADDPECQRNQSVRYSSSMIDDDGSLPFYLTPLTSSRSRKPGKSKQ